MLAVQQRHILKSDLRGVELALSRAASAARARVPVRDAGRGARRAGGAGAFRAGRSACRPEQLDAGEPLSGAFAYSAYVYWLAANGTTAEFAGAFLVNLRAWGANCARVSRALQANYGLAKEDVAFFDLFANAPPGFEEKGLEVVEEGLEQGADPVLIRRAARLLQRYELMFWDTIWDRSKS